MLTEEEKLAMLVAQLRDALRELQTDWATYLQPETQDQQRHSLEERITEDIKYIGFMLGIEEEEGKQ